jgi:hypothetical protein
LGRAPQQLVGEAGGDIRVVIRQISDLSMPERKLCGADGIDPDQFTEKRLAAK